MICKKCGKFNLTFIYIFYLNFFKFLFGLKTFREFRCNKCLHLHSYKEKQKLPLLRGILALVILDLLMIKMGFSNMTSIIFVSFIGLNIVVFYNSRLE